MPNDKPPDRQPDADTAKTKDNADYFMDKLNKIDKKVDDKIIELGKKIDEVAGQMMSEFGEKMESLNGQMDELISSIYSNPTLLLLLIRLKLAPMAPSMARASRALRASCALPEPPALASASCPGAGSLCTWNSRLN